MERGATNHSVSARIGMVNFINTAPIYEIWRETVERPEWAVTEAAPTELNRMLCDGMLDLGFISSHEYAANPAKYKLLNGLSISATGAVGSVFLFSKVAPDNLTGCKVLLSAQSQTSISLLAIILEKFFSVTPEYETGSIADIDTSRFDSVLAIGDEALRLSAQGTYPIKLDLGQVWYENTGLPFVFAVWAVREEFCRTDSDNVFAIHQELLRCLDKGLGELQRISNQVAPRIPMPEKECLKYLKGIEYDLAEDKREGLRVFIEYLIEHGDADPASLPLKICG